MSRSEERRQAREAQADMRKFYYLFGAVAAIGIGVVGYNVGSSVFSSAVTAPIELDVANDEELAELAQANTLGDAEAPAEIIEFGDYQCPGCGAFALTVKPQIERNLVQTGRARFIFYDFPLVSIHPNSFLAARASRCAADQEKFWEYHQALFRNQSRWSSASMPTSAFEDYAVEVGMDERDFSSCLNSAEHADVVTANMQVATRLGVNSTPTVFVNANGQLRAIPSADFQGISEAIEEMLSPDPSN